MHGMNNMKKIGKYSNDLLVWPNVIIRLENLCVSIRPRRHIRI